MTATQQDFEFLTGTVVVLNHEAGFGYVKSAEKAEQYIFVYGTACSRREAFNLRLGQQVDFEISGKRRVENLTAQYGLSHLEDEV